MALRLYNVGFRFVKAPTDATSLEKAFNPIGTWARINVYNWYVWSEYTPDQIYNMLVHTITADDSMVILAGDHTSYKGWAPKWFWEWIEKNKPRS